MLIGTEGHRSPRNERGGTTNGYAYQPIVRPRVVPGDESISQTVVRLETNSLTDVSGRPGAYHDFRLSEGAQNDPADRKDAPLD